ncbi:MAG: hypothetical protein NZM04_09810 [Methylacidiphilales bacterium]|nr:hypothetical protein [Candidatus Methylacidiphilales bacterium]
MHPPSSTNASSATPLATNPIESLDLDLPEIPPDQSPPLYHSYSYQARVAHARLLLADKTEAYYSQRIAITHPEPFHLD